MATFAEAWPTILAHEGTKFTHDPVDPGGATKYGISARHVGWGPERIRDLSEAEAREIYERDFWLPLNLNRVKHQALATKLMDVGIHVGTGRVVRWLFEGLINLGYTPSQEEPTRGVLLSDSVIDLANEALPEALIREIRTRQILHYTRLIALRPALKKYERGWMRRANAL